MASLRAELWRRQSTPQADRANRLVDQTLLIGGSAHNDNIKYGKLSENVCNFKSSIIDEKVGTTTGLTLEIAEANTDDDASNKHKIRHLKMRE